MFYFVLGLVGFIFGWFVSGVLVSRKWFPFVFGILIPGVASAQSPFVSVVPKIWSGSTRALDDFWMPPASAAPMFEVAGGMYAELAFTPKIGSGLHFLYVFLTLDADGKICFYTWGIKTMGPLYPKGSMTTNTSFAVTNKATQATEVNFPNFGEGIILYNADGPLVLSGIQLPTTLPSQSATGSTPPTSAPVEMSAAEDALHDAIENVIPTGSQLSNIGTTSRDAFDDVIPVNTLLNVLGAGTLSPTTQQAHDAFATLVNHFAPSMASGPGVLTEGMGTFATPAATIVSAAFVSNYSGAFPTPSWASIIDRWMVAIGSLQGQVPVAFSFVRFIGGFIVTWGFVWAMWRMLCWAVGEKMPSMMTVVGWLPGWWKSDDEDLGPPMHYGLGDGEDWKDADVHEAIAGSSHYKHAMEDAFDEIDSDDPGRQ